jgi:uncharacterized protein YkwD
MKLIPLFILSLFFLSFEYLQQDNKDFEKVQTVLAQKINDYRVKKRKPELLLEEGLQKSAQNQSDYLLKIGRLTHNQSDKNLRTTKDRIKYFSSISYFSYGENCLKTYGDLRNLQTSDVERIAEEMFQLWRTSKPHNENLLNSMFTHVGYGFCSNPKTQEIYCVMDFGGN